MSQRTWRIWFSVVSLIAGLWGIVYTIFGLGLLPLAREVLLPWESALYGSILIGWATTLFLTGRIALARGDRKLLQAILIGIAVWLAIEAIFSARLSVWFNVGVDVVVLGLFSVPLVASLRRENLQIGKPAKPAGEQQTDSE